MTFIYNEVINLAEAHEVLVICQKRNSEQKFPFENYRLLQKASWIERAFFGTLKKLGWNSTYQYSLHQQLNNIINEFAPDLIHAHFGSAGVSMLDNTARQKTPIVVSFHGVDASARLRVKSYRRRIARLLEDVRVYPIFVSNYMKQRFQSLHLCTDRSHILYYGTKTDLFKRSVRPSKQPYTFLQVASFRDKKGQFYTIKAFHKLKEFFPKKPIKLVFVGEGPLLPECKYLVSELQLSADIEFRGMQGTTEILTALNEAHCFLHHSITADNGNQEGIPNAIMEAMAMELPVISTYHSGIPELVEHGKNGFLVTEKDVADYAEKMKDILEWDYLPINRRKIEDTFEEKKHAKRLSHIFAEVLASSN